MASIWPSASKSLTAVVRYGQYQITDQTLLSNMLNTDLSVILRKFVHNIQLQLQESGGPGE